MKVCIRPLEEADASTSVGWRNIPEIWAYTASRPDHEITPEEELAWIRRVLADPACRRFAILADGRYVGNTYLTGIAGGEAEYHIFIGERDAWGKGIARQATTQLLALAKSRLHLAHIHLSVHQANTGAVGLYRSIGFVPTRQAGADDFITMTLDLNSFEEEKSHE